MLQRIFYGLRVTVTFVGLGAAVMLLPQQPAAAENLVLVGQGLGCGKIEKACLNSGGSEAACKAKRNQCFVKKGGKKEKCPFKGFKGRC